MSYNTDKNNKNEPKAFPHFDYKYVGKGVWRFVTTLSFTEFKVMILDEFTILNITPKDKYMKAAVKKFNDRVDIYRKDEEKEYPYIVMKGLKIEEFKIAHKEFLK